MITLYHRIDLRIIFIITACLLIPITLLARHAATGLLIGMFTIAVCSKLYNNAEFKLTWPPSTKAFSLLVVWACLTCLWSPDMLLSLSSSLRFALISFLGCTLLQFIQSFKLTYFDDLQKYLLISFCASLGIIVLALFNKYLLHIKFLALFFNPKAMDHATSLLALLMWPVIYCMVEKNQRLLAVFLLVGSFVAIFYQNNHTAVIAVLFTLMVWGISVFSPIRWTQILKVMIPLFMAIAPLLPKTVLAPEVLYLSVKELQVKTSLAHRFHIWSLISHRIGEHPFQGLGMEANRIEYDYILKTKAHELNKLNFANFLPQSNFSQEVTGAALHPHNATLQVWVELGIPGIIMAIVIVWLILREIETIKHQRCQRMALATFIAVLIIAHSSYGIWQTWWMASLWIITISVICLINQTNQRNSL